MDRRWPSRRNSGDAAEQRIGRPATKGNRHADRGATRTPMTATGLSSSRMSSRRPRSTNCAGSPTNSCAASARVAANDDVYDLEDSHSRSRAARAPAEGAAPDPPGLFPRQPQRERSSRSSKDLWGSGPLRHRQAQHEIGRLRRAGRMAPGLGLLPAHQRRPRRGRHHARRCRHGERPDDGRAGQPQGADL